MATPIRIKVGCSLESGWDKPFSSIEKRSRNAADKVAKNMGNMAPRARRTSTSEAERAEKRVTQTTKAEAQKRLEAIRREARQRAREHKQVLSEVQREERRSARQREREAAAASRRKAQAERQQAREVDRFARRTSHRTTRFFWGNAPVMNMARRTATDLAHGAGIETNLGGAFGRGIELESRATSLSNQAYQEGAAGLAGVRQDPKAIIADVQAIGDAQAMAYADALGGLEAFVTKTGDLQGGRDILGDMAAIAGATGSNLQDVVDAAGDVSNALGDIPNKSEAIVDTMRAIAGQGKLGSVEVKDLATQMAKLSAAATQFEGNRAETLKSLGALAQVARATGGASSARQAATSIQGFVNTLNTPARLKEFQRQGVDVFNTKGQLRDPLSILKGSISASRGDPVELKKMWANVIGAKAVTGFASEYRNAGGGEQGMAAVDKMLSRFLDAQIGAKEIADSNARRLETDAAKVQQFNNELEKVGNDIRAELAPTLKELSPHIIEAVRAFGDLVGWMARNPGAAMGAAITASFGRASVESALRTGIERMLTQSAPATGQLAAQTTAATNSMSTFQKALASLAMFTAAYTATSAILNEDERRRIKGKDTALMTDVQTSVEIGNAQRLAREQGGITKDRAEKMGGIQEQLRSRIAEAENPAWFYNTFTQKGRDKYEQKERDRQNLDQLRAELQQVQTILSGNTLQVRVTNPEDMRAPGDDAPPAVDQRGRGGQ